MIAYSAKMRCLNAGMTASDAAAELGCSVRNLHLWAKTHGFAWAVAHDVGGAQQRLPNDPKLQALWLSEATMDDMARAAGYSVSGMIKAARRYGWGERPAQRRRREAQAPAAAPAPAPDLTTITGQLLATGGRYAALAKLAAEKGWSTVKAQQEFHKARFAARHGGGV